MATFSPAVKVDKAPRTDAKISGPPRLRSTKKEYIDLSKGVEAHHEKPQGAPLFRTEKPYSSLPDNVIVVETHEQQKVPHSQPRLRRTKKHIGHNDETTSSWSKNTPKLKGKRQEDGSCDQIGRPRLLTKQNHTAEGGNELDGDIWLQLAEENTQGMSPNGRIKYRVLPK